MKRVVGVQKLGSPKKGPPDRAGGGLEAPHKNFLHQLTSTTVLCFVDREGLLTDTCRVVSEVAAGWC